MNAASTPSAFRREWLKGEEIRIVTGMGLHFLVKRFDWFNKPVCKRYVQRRTRAVKHIKHPGQTDAKAAVKPTNPAMDLAGLLACNTQ
jgi:hypothetical protein